MCSSSQGQHVNLGKEKPFSARLAPLHWSNHHQGRKQHFQHNGKGGSQKLEGLIEKDTPSRAIVTEHNSPGRIHPSPTLKVSTFMLYSWCIVNN